MKWITDKGFPYGAVGKDRTIYTVDERGVLTIYPRNKKERSLNLKETPKYAMEIADMIEEYPVPEKRNKMRVDYKRMRFRSNNPRGAA